MSSLTPEEEKAGRELIQLFGRLGTITQNDKTKNQFLDFVKAMWPSFIAGRHHKMVAEKLEAVARG